jgi:hypothetical protein
VFVGYSGKEDEQGAHANPCPSVVSWRGEVEGGQGWHSSTSSVSMLWNLSIAHIIARFSLSGVFLLHSRQMSEAMDFSRLGSIGSDREQAEAPEP